MSNFSAFSLCASSWILIFFLKLKALFSPLQNKTLVKEFLNFTKQLSDFQEKLYKTKNISFFLSLSLTAQ
jgi:hypothetical protein